MPALHIPADQDAVPHIPADQDAAPVVQNPLVEPPQPHIDLDAITDQVTRAVMEKFESIHSINTSITTRSSGTSFIDLDKGFNSQIMNVSNELGYDVQNSVKMKIINNEHVNLGRELHKLQVQDNRLQHPVVMFQTANQCSALSKIAYTPVNPWVLKKMLNSYPNQSDAELLFNGFLNGFKLNYDGPRQATDCQNLKSLVWPPSLSQMTDFIAYLSIKVSPQRQQGHALQSNNIRYVPHLNALEINFPHSKSDQFLHGFTIFIPSTYLPMCTVKAVRFFYFKETTTTSNCNHTSTFLEETLAATLKWVFEFNLYEDVENMEGHFKYTSIILFSRKK
ncbi:hypothetical protein KUTeg_008074 [Tegillarca granosa]|uniref:Uncharacterized protein n=1 Tax=Tegillarca granosa TaxID=220873 RepID=A0ABQ9FCW7_TEGGR|nr:hypothetical protein KUTeg_008074 [Tegillarca granosa]